MGQVGLPQVSRAKLLVITLLTGIKLQLACGSFLGSACLTNMALGRARTKKVSRASCYMSYKLNRTSKDCDPGIREGVELKTSRSSLYGTATSRKRKAKLMRDFIKDFTVVSHYVRDP